VWWCRLDRDVAAPKRPSQASIALDSRMLQIEHNAMMFCTFTIPPNRSCFILQCSTIYPVQHQGAHTTHHTAYHPQASIPFADGKGRGTERKPNLAQGIGKRPAPPTFFLNTIATLIDYPIPCRHRYYCPDSSIPLSFSSTISPH
jgi:hypothetical protein